jgi:ribosomal protein L11 methyltransferase
VTRYVLIETPVADLDALSDRLWQLPGILGIQELPADGRALFRPDPAHHYVRFDQRAAYDDWLRTEQYRRADKILLKVYYTGNFPPGFTVTARGVVRTRDFLAPVRQHHHGHAIGPFWVGPPWKKPPPRKIPVLIEPGTAFGLGDHPTTQMCLELLGTLPKTARPRHILDFGAGSGILALAAAKRFPAARLTLVETDPTCWPEIRHNFALNRLPAPPLLEKLPARPAGRFDLVLANVYLELLQTIVLKLHAPRLIISGLLGAEQVAALRLGRLRPVRQLQRDDWFAMDLARPPTRRHRGPTRAPRAAAGNPELLPTSSRRSPRGS